MNLIEKNGCFVVCFLEHLYHSKCDMLDSVSGTQDIYTFYVKALYTVIICAVGTLYCCDVFLHTY